MPIVQDFKNLDEYFHTTSRKLLLNNFSHLETDPNELIKLLYTKYEEEITLIPQCECGYYKGAYLLGKTCPRCGTTVIKTFDEIKPILWVEKFKEDLPFLNTHFWTELRYLLNRKLDCVRWLSDTNYNPPGIPPFMHTIKELIGGRGYKNMINNIDKILLYIKNNSAFKASEKDKKATRLLELYRKNKDKLFSRFLPMINKRLFVMEVTNKGNYSNKALANVIDIALYAIKLANTDSNSKKVENGTAALISKTSDLFNKYVKDMLAGKKGMVRKHIYGSRSHFTFRAVITSMPTAYDYDELWIPWSIGVTAFRPHLLNKLMKRGYSYKEASKLLFNAVNKYYPIIDELLQELIKESPYKGVPILFNRNPSLASGSLQLEYITRFKTDVRDRTISLNMLVAKSYNADFDGDFDKGILVA
jgi:DNA-directed RNA polymerase beta' subunit